MIIDIHEAGDGPGTEHGTRPTKIAESIACPQTTPTRQPHHHLTAPRGAGGERMPTCNGSGLIRDHRLGDAPMVSVDDVQDCPGCAACEDHPFDDDDWGGGDWDDDDPLDGEPPV